MLLHAGFEPTLPRWLPHLKKQQHLSLSISISAYQSAGQTFSYWNNPTQLCHYSCMAVHCPPTNLSLSLSLSAHLLSFSYHSTYLYISISVYQLLVLIPCSFCTLPFIQSLTSPMYTPYICPCICLSSVHYPLFLSLSVSLHPSLYISCSCSLQMGEEQGSTPRGEEGGKGCYN